MLKKQIKKLIESDFIYIYISLQTRGPPLKMLWRRTSKKYVFCIEICMQIKIDSSFWKPRSVNMRWQLVLEASKKVTKASCSLADIINLRCISQGCTLYSWKYDISVVLPSKTNKQTKHSSMGHTCSYEVKCLFLFFRMSSINKMCLYLSAS